MKPFLIAIILLPLFPIQCCNRPKQSSDDIRDLAVERKQDLRLSIYITAQTVEQMFTKETGLEKVVSLLHENGITTVYLEVYRSGLVISPDVISSSVSFLEENGFEVAGGICTVPGAGIGVPQEGPLTWFNWQSLKTQRDLRKIMEDSAPFFDTFIVDDFLCTADTSIESKIARGEKNWSEYRRSLLTDLSQSVFINPAKAKNPNIKVIIKYPQWYDRFHLFGYDVDSKTKLYDGVCVGTETRGQYTQSFGFVQPYEGFINFRWLSSLAGSKIGGAWFDHIDCDADDFTDQAYQSVIAGAKELIIFNLENYITGHPGHILLRQDFEKLAELARAIAENPVRGVKGYKPPNSDASGDLYLLDYIGMFGVSIVPDSKYPEDAEVIFLPTQAATDINIPVKIQRSLEKGARIVMTTGFLANAAGGEKLAELAQVKWPLAKVSAKADTVISEGGIHKLRLPLTLGYDVIPDGAEVLLQTAAPASIPFMTQNQNKTVFVLNSHTFSQEDFEAAGELLLCPGETGLLELPRPWVNTIRSAFLSQDDPVIDAPSRISMQILHNHSFIIHNYDRQKSVIKILLPEPTEFINGFTGKPVRIKGNEIELEMAPRSRIWLRSDNGET